MQTRQLSTPLRRYRAHIVGLAVIYRNLKDGLERDAYRAGLRLSAWPHPWEVNPALWWIDDHLQPW